MGGRVNNDEGAKKSSKTIDFVSYALEVSVNEWCHMCVCSPFQVIRHILKSGLTVNIHVSTKTCVTGNNLVLHKAL